MRTQCPSCKKTFNVPDDYLNRTGKCTFCGKRFVIANIPQKTDIEEEIPIPQKQRIAPKWHFLSIGIVLLIIAIGIFLLYKYAQFQDNIKRLSDEHIEKVIKFRSEYISLFEVMDAFDEPNRQRIMYETLELFKKAAITSEVGLPIIEEYTRQFADLVKKGYITKEQYDQGLLHMLQYASLYGRECTPKLIRIMSQRGIIEPEKQGAFGRMMVIGAKIAKVSLKEFMDEYEKCLPSFKKMDWTDQKTIEFVAVILAPETPSKK